MPEKKSDYYIANQSFSMQDADGVVIAVDKGDLAEAGAPELKGHMDFFDPADINDVVKFRKKSKSEKKSAEPEMESATQAPGEKR